MHPKLHLSVQKRMQLMMQYNFLPRVLRDIVKSCLSGAILVEIID